MKDIIKSTSINNGLDLMYSVWSNEVLMDAVKAFFLTYIYKHLSYNIE